MTQVLVKDVKTSELETKNVKLLAKSACSSKIYSLITKTNEMVTSYLAYIL